MKTISTLHDPEGRYSPLVSKYKYFLKKQFSGTVIAYTSGTDNKLVSSLKTLGFSLIVSGDYGEARVGVLKKALKSESEYFFFCDFDKILHWIKVERSELKDLLKDKPKKDFVSFGRSESVFNTYPDSWQKPESITNYLVSRILGFNIDVCTSVCVLNIEAAEIVVKLSKEKDWGSCVEWPLLVYKAGLSIGCQEFAGLTWEDPDRFEKEIEKFGGLEKWKKLNYSSKDEWERRTRSLLQQARVIKKLS